jgi:agmatinase
MAFDPNAPAKPGSGVFGLTYAEADAAVVLVPVPWEATTSYGGGASQGPRVILEASRQVDLYDLDVEKPYEVGIHMLPEPSRVLALNDAAKKTAARVIEAGGASGDPELERAVASVNETSREVDAWVESETSRLLAAGKIVGVVGGDHSVPLGAFRALARVAKSFGVLHIDAHSDTRKAYEGFEGSHASIMYNALETIPAIERLVQVGIRDVCEEEVLYCRAQGPRVRMITDREMAMRKQEGESFAAIARGIAQELPDDVWISFDIDGLDPRYCPSTGTPVPGGLDVQEVITIFREVVRAGKRIVGFDLNEVAPNPTDPSDEWDGNVGARMLYKLVAFTAASQGRAKLL